MGLGQGRRAGRAAGVWRRRDLLAGAGVGGGFRAAAARGAAVERLSRPAGSRQRGERAVAGQGEAVLGGIKYGPCVAGG